MYGMCKVINDTIEPYSGYLTHERPPKGQNTAVSRLRFVCGNKELTSGGRGSILSFIGRGAMDDREEKRHILKQARALNDHPERVRAPVFSRHPFFDPQDKVQVKYELLRAREVEGVSLTEACRLYGFTRESYRHILARFRAEGIKGLFERKRGRRGPVKATESVRTFLRAERENQEHLSVQELIERCQRELGVSLSRRTVFRILDAEEEENDGKKKPSSDGELNG